MPNPFILLSVLEFLLLLLSLASISCIIYQYVRHQQPYTFLSLLGDVSFALFLLMIPLDSLQRTGWFSAEWRQVIKQLYHISETLFFLFALPFSGYMPFGRKRLQQRVQAKQKGEENQGTQSNR